jgi:D-serine deaminase-like pyridoxal phosphate-dependent protein
VSAVSPRRASGTAVGAPVAELETPALVVDLGVLERNLARVAEYSREHGLGLLPHIKTHKTLEIARMQLDAGADGLTVAKSEEAEAFARELGFPLLLHYPVVGAEKVARVADVAGEVPMTVALDSIAAAEPIAAELQRRGAVAEALVELDVGLARTGVATPEQATELAAGIEAFGGGLEVAGLSCYPGHLRHGGPAQPVAGMGAVSELLADAIQRFDRAGLRRDRVSGGSTATLFASHRTPVTEIRPGNYALLDRAEGRGDFTLGDCALRVQTTVVSTSLPGRFVIDAGAKTLSEAAPPAGLDGFGAIVGREDLRLAALSEEHGHGEALGGWAGVEVGERLEVIPNHACTCVNLHDRIYGARGGVVEAEMPVVARGMVR